MCPYAGLCCHHRSCLEGEQGGGGGVRGQGSGVRGQGLGDAGYLLLGQVTYGGGGGRREGEVRAQGHELQPKPTPSGKNLTHARNIASASPPPPRVDATAITYCCPHAAATATTWCCPRAVAAATATVTSTDVATATAAAAATATAVATAAATANATATATGAAAATPLTCKVECEVASWQRPHPRVQGGLEHPVGLQCESGGGGYFANTCD